MFPLLSATAAADGHVLALSKFYPELSKFCQSLLLLSHGQATVERGFSVYKQVETCNILEESIKALRLICDKFSVCGGILKVPLTKELLASVASARSKYRIHLEQERKKKETTTQSFRRKAAENELEVLKKKSPKRGVQHTAKRCRSTGRAGRGKICIVNGPTDHQIQHLEEKTQRKTQ